MSTKMSAPTIQQLRWGRILAVSFVAASFVVAIFFYPLLPGWVNTHWGVDGRPDGAMTKGWGLFLIPLLLTLVYLLFVLLPKIDPLRDNLRRFRGVYEVFAIAILAFLFYVQALEIGGNIYERLPFTALLAPGIGVFFFVIGYLLPRTHRNWFLGIRTPWTLQNDEVWNRTHRLGGLLFEIAGGAIVLLAFTTPRHFILGSVGLLLGAAVISVIYSYVVYRALH